MPMSRRAELSMPREALPAWAMAALIHVACAVATSVLAMRVPALTADGAWFWLEGGGAAMLGMAAGLPVWWMPINLLFAPAAHALLGAHIPAAVYLGAFCLLFAFNMAAWRHRVPLFLSSAQATAALSALLPQRAGLRVLDLGCGTGTLLLDLARARPDLSCDGVETAPLSCLISWWRVRKHKALRVSWGDFWGTDFAQYDVVYAYLSPAPMARLWTKARREMKPGSLLVSNTFVIPGVTPAGTLPTGDRMRSTLYIWRM
jgi:SAM-dependent methyltransferase